MANPERLRFYQIRYFLAALEYARFADLLERVGKADFTRLTPEQCLQVQSDLKWIRERKDWYYDRRDNAYNRVRDNTLGRPHNLTLDQLLPSGWVPASGLQRAWVWVKPVAAQSSAASAKGESNPNPGPAATICD